MKRSTKQLDERSHDTIGVRNKAIRGLNAENAPTLLLTLLDRMILIPYNFPTKCEIVGINSSLNSSYTYFSPNSLPRSPFLTLYGKLKVLYPESKVTAELI